MSRRDPSFGDRARLLYTNLSTLPLTELGFRLQPGAEQLDAARRAVLGDGAWHQRAVVRWRVTGETAAAEHTVWLTFVPEDGRPRLAGTSDVPSGPVSPQPVWWTGPVTAATDGTTTVLVGSGQDAGAWLARSRTAAAAVRRVVTTAVDHDWAGGVVVEVPASRQDFAAVLGVDADTYAQIAAVTHAEGRLASGAVRVVVNPEAARSLAPLGLDVVLTHETVHVATRSVDSPAPTWAVEGFADFVALQAHPAAGDGVAAPLLRQVREQGPPSSLPDDARFRAGRTDLATSYAEAWLACRYVARTSSPADLQRLYAALDAGRPLSEAAPDALGTSAGTLVRGWRRSLVRLAGP